MTGRHRPSWISLWVAIWAMSLTLGTASPALAQSKSILWQRLDVDIAFQPNGDLRVTETSVIQFNGGPFTFGFRDFRRVPYFEITDLVATEAGVATGDTGKPLGLQTGLTNSGDFRVQYFFATPAQDETRTFTLTYTAKDAINYVQQGDEIFWTGVFAERNGVPVAHSRIRVTLPEALPALRVEASGIQATTTGENESIVIAEAQEPIPSGTEFKLRVVFPHGLAPTPTPAPAATATSIQASPLSAPLSDAAVPTVNYMATVRAVNAERPVTYTATRTDSGENFTVCLSVVVLIGLFAIGIFNRLNNPGGENDSTNEDDDNSSRPSYRRSWTSSSSRSSSTSSRSSSSRSSSSSRNSGSSSSRGSGGGGFG